MSKVKMSQRLPGRETVRNWVTTYVVVWGVLSVGYWLLRDSTWQGTAELHTLLEVIATLLASTIAHMLKTVSYLAVLTGLLGGIFHLFKQLELRTRQTLGGASSAQGQPLRA